MTITATFNSSKKSKNGWIENDINISLSNAKWLKFKNLQLNCISISSTKNKDLWN